MRCGCYWLSRLEKSVVKQSPKVDGQNELVLLMKVAEILKQGMERKWQNETSDAGKVSQTHQAQKIK